MTTLLIACFGLGLLLGLIGLRLLHQWSGKNTSEPPTRTMRGHHS
ncbi:MAG TPA: hypothetical protein VFS21_04535 [Roseiflexaceae bacterium]|nr:hypothetical protein [Roseiflexaceae bacterium]